MVFRENFNPVDALPAPETEAKAVLRILEGFFLVSFSYEEKVRLGEKGGS